MLSAHRSNHRHHHQDEDRESTSWLKILVYYVLPTLTIILVAGYPFFRIESIKYKEFMIECEDFHERAGDMKQFHICAIPEMRERYKDFVDCDKAKKTTVIDVRDCAFRKWWTQFLPVRAYTAVAGTWYFYLLCAALCGIIVWTGITAGANIMMHRASLKQQKSMFRDFQRTISQQQIQSLPPPSHRYDGHSKRRHGYNGYGRNNRGRIRYEGRRAVSIEEVE